MDMDVTLISHIFLATQLMQRQIPEFGRHICDILKGLNYSTKSIELLVTSIHLRYHECKSYQFI